MKEAIAAWEKSIKEWEASAPSERENVDITKVQKKLESAKAKVAPNQKNPSTAPRASAQCTVASAAAMAMASPVTR